MKQVYYAACDRQGYPTVAAMITAFKTGSALPPLPEAVAPSPSEERFTDPVMETQRRRERLREAQRERELLEAVAGEHSIRDYLEKLAGLTAPVFDPAPAWKPLPRRGRQEMSEVPVQLLGDWHGGERVSAEGTRGLNTFSLGELARRARSVIQSHLSIKQKMEEGGWRFPRLVVPLMGDFVSGTIHELERHSDAKNIVMSVYAVATILAQALRDLAAVYPRLDVYVISGNHGRLGDARKVQSKDPMRNWDTMVALLVRESLREIKHLQFEIPNSYSVAFEVEGWNFLQTHGHDVKSWNQIPWYGLNRLVTNINAIEAARQRTIHYWLFGHFHTKSSLEHAAGEAFINGSLIGPTEWTLNALGRADRPNQLLLMVHREHGVTSRWPLNASVGDGSAYEVPAEALAA